MPIQLRLIKVYYDGRGYLQNSLTYTCSFLLQYQFLLNHHQISSTIVPSAPQALIAEPAPEGCRFCFIDPGRGNPAAMCFTRKTRTSLGSVQMILLGYKEPHHGINKCSELALPRYHQPAKQGFSTFWYLMLLKTYSYHPQPI